MIDIEIMSSRSVICMNYTKLKSLCVNVIRNRIRQIEYICLFRISVWKVLDSRGNVFPIGRFKIIDL